MTVILVGLNHRTAPIEVRERVGLSPDRWVTLNEKLVCGPELREAAILSTCNRTEIVGIADRPVEGLARLAGFLGDAPAVKGTYRLSARDAVQHLFRVAASLDSMVVGEAQILGQIKDAYRAAVTARSCGPILNRLFERAFRAAKRVRAETSLGTGAVSVATLGVQIAQELFESFEGKRILLLGAGEMAESALGGLRRAGARSIVLANRTLEAAERLAAQVGGSAVPLSSLDGELVRADIFVSSIQVEAPLVSVDRLERAISQRHGRPLLVIDLGLPRNLDPEAQRLEGLFLYDLDDLDGMAAQGRARRKGEVQIAEKIVEEEVEWFERWLVTLSSVPAIRELVERAEALAYQAARRTVSRLPKTDSETEAAIERLAREVVRKVLHRPLVRLRKASGDEVGDYYTDVVRHLFTPEEDE
ncbi:MAG: glutamyl-tRNA reductase [Myxococcota bacterium]